MRTWCRFRLSPSLWPSGPRLRLAHVRHATGRRVSLDVVNRRWFWLSLEWPDHGLPGVALARDWPAWAAIDLHDLAADAVRHRDS